MIPHFEYCVSQHSIGIKITSVVFTWILMTLTKLTKILLDLLRGSLLTDAAHEDLPGLGLLALGLGRGGLGVYLLAVEDVRGDGQHPLQGRGRGESDEPESSAALNIMVEFRQYLILDIF